MLLLEFIVSWNVLGGGTTKAIGGTSPDQDCSWYPELAVAVTVTTVPAL